LIVINYDYWLWLPHACWTHTHKHAHTYITICMYAHVCTTHVHTTQHTHTHKTLHAYIQYYTHTYHCREGFRLPTKKNSFGCPIAFNFKVFVYMLIWNVAIIVNTTCACTMELFIIRRTVWWLQGRYQCMELWSCLVSTAVVVVNNRYR